jgi:hypothetical protein
MQTIQRLFASTLVSATASVACGQAPAALKPFVIEDAPVLVMEHVRVIDGTGAPAKDDQWIEIANGKIVCRPSTERPTHLRDTQSY